MRYARLVKACRSRMAHLLDTLTTSEDKRQTKEGA